MMARTAYPGRAQGFLRGCHVALRSAHCKQSNIFAILSGLYFLLLHWTPAFPSCFLQARSQCGPGHAFLIWKPHISDVSKTENKRYSPSIASCRLWSTNGLGYRTCSSAASRLASSKVLDGHPPYFPCLRLPTRVHGRLTKSSLCNRGGYGSPSKILQPQPTTNSRPLISNLSTRTHTHVFFAHG